MHLTLDLNEHLAARLHEAAQAAGVPPAEWIEQLIENHTAPAWPASVKALIGAWRDEPVLVLRSRRIARALLMYLLDTNTLIYFFNLPEAA